MAINGDKIRKVVELLKSFAETKGTALSDAAAGYLALRMIKREIQPKRQTMISSSPGAVQPDPVSEANASGTRRGEKRKSNSVIATKDLEQWKPQDDLALIIGVQQANDIETVHLGAKFSCRFTLQAVEQRWYDLLYNKDILRAAVTAIRNLQLNMVAAVQNKALWSKEEDQILETLTSDTDLTLEMFSEMLMEHPDTFHSRRTPLSLRNQWNSLNMHNLLSGKIMPPLPEPYSSNPVLYVSDAEDLALDCDSTGPADESFDRNLRLQQRKILRDSPFGK